MYVLEYSLFTIIVLLFLEKGHKSVTAAAKIENMIVFIDKEILVLLKS